MSRIVIQLNVLLVLKCVLVIENNELEICTWTLALIIIINLS